MTEQEDKRTVKIKTYEFFAKLSTPEKIAVYSLISLVAVAVWGFGYWVGGEIGENRVAKAEIDKSNVVSDFQIQMIAKESQITELTRQVGDLTSKAALLQQERDNQLSHTKTSEIKARFVTLLGNYYDIKGEMPANSRDWSNPAHKEIKRRFDSSQKDLIDYTLWLEENARNPNGTRLATICRDAENLWTGVVFYDGSEWTPPSLLKRKLRRK
ncbi:hypothetical protein [uncultured Gimesia sp.]|uniref:hypothetical protein n=1 Tax=uncultured Gimesia sp. TaxID=1678688 RepID=UPI00262541EE|nr:hypothetical protein [uncultured Gimesia sp.]